MSITRSDRFNCAGTEWVLSHERVFSRLTLPVGIFVVSSLVVKRQFEQRKRPWRIWLWDVSKQLVGQAMIHALNLLVSTQRSALAHGLDLKSRRTRCQQ